ncbi:MAG: acyl--CoA ligase [Hyphomonadaceae bacterium]|nr:acyl--CoA ligase [Hyphomonadaceae bacterium]
MSKIIQKTDPLLPDIFALHGKWRANKPAIIADDEALNWDAFTTRNNQIANGLSAMGLKKGDCVVVLMSNGMAMAEALFGIMTGGFVSAPLNTSVSDDAINNMILDSGAKAIIATGDQALRLESIADQLPEKTWKNRICAEAGRQGWRSFEKWRDAQSSDTPDVRIEPQHYLNIIYSSGTTGQPKGIVHTHQGRRDWAYDLSIALRYNSSARFLATIGMYSNITWVGMLCALLAGGTIYISRKFDAPSLWSQIERDRITHLAMVPIMYERMMDVPGHEEFDVTSMQGMMSAGSPLRAPIRTSMFDRFPCGIIELYGLTEGVITTLDPEDASGHMDSVGKPLLGTDLMILDDDDKVCQVGQSGEILACGRIVMPEYLGRKQATLETLFVDTNGTHWLRTGDIGYLDVDNFLYIVDRKKDMILSGGQNIYPQDIEAVIATHDEVEDVAVIGVKSNRWGETPIALVALRTPDGDANAIKDWVNARLGKQQRVADVKIVDEILRNPNGKILKRELRKDYEDVEYD